MLSLFIVILYLYQALDRELIELFELLDWLEVLGGEEDEDDDEELYP
jgi:hypothetical protein